MLEEDFFQVGLFSIRVGLFLARGGLFSIGVGLFLVGGGLFLSPTVAEKSPTPAEKSPTAILKRCWTLEYFGELEFSSPFMEQWTLDARGVLKLKSQYPGFNEDSKPGDNIDWRVTIRVEDAEKGEKVEESFCATNV